MGQNPIEGSNPSLSANLFRLSVAPPRPRPQLPRPRKSALIFPFVALFSPVKPVLFAVFFACAFAVFPANATLYACIGADGKKSYTSNPNSAECVQQPSYEPGAPKVAPPPKPVPPKPAVKTRAPSPPKKINIPSIKPQEQSGRDIRRREILVHELQSEIKYRDAYRRGINKADNSKVRDHYRRLIRIHELNILAIQGELNLLGANSARN